MKKDYLKYTILILVFLLVFGLNFNFNTKNQDIWLHLAYGKYFLEEKTFPKEDVFNFTTIGKQEALHEWLFQLIVYLIYLKLGMIYLIILNALTMALLFLFFYKLINQTFYLSITLTTAALFATHY